MARRQMMRPYQLIANLVILVHSRESHPNVKVLLTFAIRDPSLHAAPINEKCRARDASARGKDLHGMRVSLKTSHLVEDGHSP